MREKTHHEEINADGRCGGRSGERATGCGTCRPVNPAAPPTPTTQAKLLLGETKGLARGTAQRGQLLALAERVRTQQRGGQACLAVDATQDLRALIQRMPACAQKRLLAVDSAALGVQQQLLASKRTKKCGGGAGAASVKAPSPKLARSDRQGLELTVDLPEIGVGAQHRGGKLRTQLAARQAEVPGQPGEPGIPTASFSIAVPEGASVQTRAVPGASYALRGVNVLPVQNEAVDRDVPKPNFYQGAFPDPKFVAPRRGSYAKPFPGKAADVVSCGRARDADDRLIASSQHRQPASRQLHLARPLAPTLGAGGRVAVCSHWSNP